jgi:hypothetical protein
MGYIFAFLPYIFQLLLIIHMIKRNKPFVWLWLIVFLPYIGGLVYFIMEVLPELIHSQSVSNMGSAIDGRFHPNKKIEDLERLVKRQGTISNIVQLADAYSEAGNYEKAVELYKSCLQGPYEHDGEIQFKIVNSLFRAGNIPFAQEALRIFKEHNEISNQEQAIIEILVNQDFAKLQDIFDNTSNFEVGYNLVKHYIEIEDLDKAEAIIEEMKEIRTEYPMYKSGQNATWFKLSKRLLSDAEK